MSADLSANSSVQSRKLRAVVVDDVPRIALEIAAVLEGTKRVDVVGIASNPVVGIRHAQMLQPNLVVLDGDTAMLGALESALRIRQQLPEARILITSAGETSQMCAVATTAGADALICKGDLRSECAAVIDRLFPR